MESFPNGKSRRPLSELLHEEQEPFMLKEFLSERQYLCGRLEGGGAMKKSSSKMGPNSANANGKALWVKASSPLRSPAAMASCIGNPSASASRLLEAALRILEPGMRTCSRPRSSFSFPNGPTTVRCLLEMDRRAARSRKRPRKRNLVKPRLEESNGRNPRRKSPRSHFDADCARGASAEPGDFMAGANSGASSSHFGLNAWQRASEALISAFGLSSPAEENRGSAVPYSRILGSGNEVEDAEACLARKRAGYGLLKSILRRLSPSKESGKTRCRSRGIDESGVLGSNPTGGISKRFSNAMRSLSGGACRQELQGDDEVRLRVRDIVRWGSFDESSEGRDSCVGQSANGGCIPLECPTNLFAEVMSEEAEAGRAKMKVVGSKWNEENWQAFLKRRRNNASSDFSTTSSSSAWLETCVDSDSASTSLDVFSSNGSSEGNGGSDSRELKGIDLCVLEALSPRGYLSLEVDENGGVKDFNGGVKDFNGGVKDFHHGPRCDLSRSLMACHQIEDIAASNAITEPGYLHCCPSSVPRGLGALQISDDNGSPARTNIGPSCAEIEEETIPCICDNISDTSRHGCNQSDGCEEVSDAGCFEEVEQLSPVSVLDSPFEEENSGFEETLANIQRAKQQLLQKICEYECLAHMDPTLLENRMASWKEEPSEDEAYSSCTDDETRRMSTMVEPAKMDWEEGETEEYVREVLNCSQTVSEDLTSLTLPRGCLDDRRSCVAEDLNDIQMQVCAGSCYASGYCPSQGLKAKQLSEQARRLLFDRVNEELQSAGKCYGNGLMAELWLRDQLAKKICGQILAWKEVGASHTDRLVELDLNRKGGEWRSFREEAEEIGAKIELAIFGVLVEEVLVDLAHFHTCKDSHD